MTKNDQREIQRKLRVLEHAEQSGQVSKTCRYFGIGRASFYRWKRAYARNGEDGLANAKPIPKSSPNQTPPEVEEKVLHLRRKYHLGPERIMWYMARYHAVSMSDATIYRILRRHGLNRLPRGTRVRKIHTKRYNKQVPGHHIQMDVKFLTFFGRMADPGDNPSASASSGRTAPVDLLIQALLGSNPRLRISSENEDIRERLFSIRPSVEATKLPAPCRR